MRQDEYDDKFPYGTGILYFFSMVGLVITQSITHGLTLTIMWGWFVQKLFPACPPLSIPLAIGLMETVRLLQRERIYPGPQDKKEQETKAEGELQKVAERRVTREFWNGLRIIVSKALLILLIGWIVKQFL